MNKAVIVPSLLSLALVMSGCAASPANTDTATPQPGTASPVQATATPAATPTPAAVPETAEDWAEQVKQETSTKIVLITEDNDPNDLIGRPNGYTDAAVIYDKEASCTSLGTDCGATIEIWPSQADAQNRSNYIQGILKDTPAFGTEYHAVNGNALLRVTGKVKPSVAKGYQEAFEG